MSNDHIDHPAHYNSHPSGVEAIELTEVLGFNLGNALKYIIRHEHKGAALDDLRKARWYVRREADRDPPQPRHVSDVVERENSFSLFVEAEPSPFVKNVAWLIWNAAQYQSPQTILVAAEEMLCQEIARREAAP